MAILLSLFDQAFPLQFSIRFPHTGSLHCGPYRRGGAQHTQHRILDDVLSP